MKSKRAAYWGRGAQKTSWHLQAYRQQGFNKPKFTRIPVQIIRARNYDMSIRNVVNGFWWSA